MKSNFLINILNGLRLWQKFLLLGIVALLIAAYPIYTTVKNTLDTLDNVRAERYGIAPLTLVEDIIQSLQDHRTAASYFVQNDSTRAAPRTKAATDVEQELAQLEQLAATTNDTVLIRRLAEVKQEWALLKAEVEASKLEAREVVSKHTSLIAKSILMIEDWTAYSLIDLDPDAAAYYAFRAALIDLPLLKEAIRSLRSPVTDRLEELAKAKGLAAQATQAAAGEAAMRNAWRAEDRAHFLDTIQLAEASARRYSENMRKAMAVSPSIKAELGEQVSQLTQLTEQAMQYARRELLSKDYPTVDAATYTREVSVSRAAAIKLGEQSGPLLSKVLNDRETNAKRSLYAQIGGALALMLLGFAIAWLTVRSITGTVNGLQVSVEKVRQGDFKALQLIQSKDEVGDLGRTVNNLLQERIAAQRKAEKENELLNNSVVGLLQTVFQLGNRDLTVRAPVTEDVIGTVASSINQLTEQTGSTLSGVQQIAEQVRNTALSVRQQASVVEETVKQERVSLDRMTGDLTQATQQLIQVASLSTATSQTADKAANATNAALQAVDGTVKGMDGLRESISEMEKRFKRLGERSQEISIAVGLINTISERTHVLALNASMQAATAGEAGRGFVVVAEEVQRLSDSSRQATSQISQLVGNIQAETNETLFTVNRLISQVVQQSELAQRAGTQMTQTQETTTQLVGLVQQIAAFSKQQTELANTLQKGVLEINKGNEQSTQATIQQTKNTQTLAEYARRLTESVAQFKLNTQAPA